MASRAIGSGTISFGLVSIPVKLYTATSPQRVSFNFLHEKCGTRVKMQYYCPFDQEVLTRLDQGTVLLQPLAFLIGEGACLLVLMRLGFGCRWC